jgi:chaperonin cofactor prefoldin
MVLTNSKKAQKFNVASAQMNHRINRVYEAVYNEAMDSQNKLDELNLQLDKLNQEINDHNDVVNMINYIGENL